MFASSMSAVANVAMPLLSVVAFWKVGAVVAFSPVAFAENVKLSSSLSDPPLTVFLALSVKLPLAAV